MASASAVKAGEAFVSLFLDVGELKSSLANAGKDLKAFFGGLDTIGKGLISFGGMILAPIKQGMDSLMEYAGELRKLAHVTGSSVENLSLLAYAAKIAGLEFEDLGKASKFIHKNLDGMDEESAAASEAFHRLGLSVTALKGMKFEDQLLAVSEQFSKLTNDVERGALAQKIFGKQGEAMLNFLKRGKDGIRGLMEEGREMGAGLTGAEATALKEFGLEMKRMENTARFAFMALGKAVIPALGDLSKLRAEMRSLINGVRLFIQNNGNLIITIAKIALGSIAVGTALTTLGFVFTQLGVVLTFVTTMAGAFWTVLTGPVGAVLAIAAAVALLFANTEKGAGFIAKMGEDWGKTWGGMLAAVRSGNMEAAFNIVILRLKANWLGLAEMFEKGMDGLFGGGDGPKNAGLDEFGKPLKEGMKGFDDAVNRSMKTFTGFMTFIYYGWLAIFKVIEKVGEGIGELLTTGSVKNARASFEKEIADLKAEFRQTMFELDTDRGAAKRGHLKSPAERAKDAADAAAADAVQADIWRRMKAAWARRNAGAKGEDGAGGGGFQLPAFTAGTFSGYALGQSFARADKVGERMAAGIERIDENTKKMADAQPPVHK